MKIFHYLFIIIFTLYKTIAAYAHVSVGIDTLFNDTFYTELIKGKRIGLITNHTAINHDHHQTREILKNNAHSHHYKLAALFAPEHGITGSAHESEWIKDGKDPQGIPIYSLHGSTRRPTPEMLKNVDLLIYDIQDIGSRSYTYTSTLFYAMEEAAKLKIPVMVLDRPNPINGIVIDGPMLHEKWRSFVGYINVPYCHGMTIGELARFFNEEYHVGCELHVVPMQGWKRHMSFNETGLTWTPTSPNIPESTTPYYYPMTGLLGELQIVNIGIGYTLPFKIVGAPWINAEAFAKHLNDQKFPGVVFQPFHFKPFHGRFSHKNCQGVLILVTNHRIFKPVSTQYLILGALKNLYPEQMQKGLAESKSRKEMFCKVNGTEEVYRIIVEKEHIIWPLRALHQEEREIFLTKRKKYLISSYSP